MRRDAPSTYRKTKGSNDRMKSRFGKLHLTPSKSEDPDLDNQPPIARIVHDEEQVLPSRSNRKNDRKRTPSAQVDTNNDAYQLEAHSPVGRDAPSKFEFISPMPTALAHRTLSLRSSRSNDSKNKKVYGSSYDSDDDFGTIDTISKDGDTFLSEDVIVRESTQSTRLNQSTQSPQPPLNQTDDIRTNKKYRKRHRGFSTSVSALLSDESIVCGAFSCFGILLSSRTEYFLNVRNERRGIKRRAPSRVIGVIFLVMMSLLVLSLLIWGVSENVEEGRRMAGTETNHIHTVRGVMKLKDWYDLQMYLFSVLVVSKGSKRNLGDGSSTEDISKQRDIFRAVLATTFLFILGVVGRRRRMRTRYAIIRAREKDDYLHLVSDENEQQIRTDSSLDHYDSRANSIKEDKYEGACSHTLCGCYPVDPPAPSISEDIEQDSMNHGFRCWSLACCGLFCRCWIQCLSICALAQEAREARSLIPLKYQQVDYITHQSFTEYHADHAILRRKRMAFYDEIDDIEAGFGCRLHCNGLSTLSRYILVAFVLSVAVIVLVMIINPDSQFGIANGFVVVATFAESFLILYLSHWVFHKSDLSLDAVIKLFAAGFIIGTPTAYVLEGIMSIFVLLCSYIILIIFFDEDEDSKSAWMFWISGEFLSAYLIAALMEELCKYYTFRFVEHPDLLFMGPKKEEEQNSTMLHQEAEQAWIFRYPSFAQRTTGQSYDSDASPYSINDDSILESPVAGKPNSMRELNDANDDSADDVKENPLFVETRTIRSTAAAIRIAMVSTAVGFACAENFIYVFFVVGGNSAGIQTVILLIRSIFPVHALCAAIQSNVVIQKYLEKQPNIGVGKIILPSVIMHGSFDAVLMGIDLYMDSQVYAQNASVIWASVIGFLLIIFVFLAGVWWYVVASRKQRLRLIVIMEKELKNRKSTGFGKVFSPTGLKKNLLGDNDSLIQPPTLMQPPTLIQPPQRSKSKETKRKKKKGFFGKNHPRLSKEEDLLDNDRSRSPKNPSRSPSRNRKILKNPSRSPSRNRKSPDRKKQNKSEGYVNPIFPESTNTRFTRTDRFS